MEKALLASTVVRRHRVCTHLRIVVHSSLQELWMCLGCCLLGFICLHRFFYTTEIWTLAPSLATPLLPWWHVLAQRRAARLVHNPSSVFWLKEGVGPSVWWSHAVALAEKQQTYSIFSEAFSELFRCSLANLSQALQDFMSPWHSVTSADLWS